MLWVGHLEEDFLEVVGPGEVAADLVGNEQGLVVDLGLAVGVDALLEDADDGQRTSLTEMVWPMAACALPYNSSPGAG
jgi:hypothetical protein